ncbi:MAG: ParA family protein [Bacteroidota bacterium]|nr:MAG: ParA family protein [Bacteroidota bacterium]
MAVIISFANQKGGAGKSFMTELFAKALNHSYKKKVLVIDCDPQWTITELRKDHARNFPELPFRYDCKAASLKQIEKIAKENNEKYNYILVDIPGFMHTPDGEKNYLIDLLRICDVIFMPLKASEAVLKSSAELYHTIDELIEDKKKMGFDMDVWAYLNLYKNNSENIECSADDFALLKNRGFKNMLKTHLSEIAGYQRTFEHTPESVMESPFVNKDHKKQFQQLVKEMHSITSSYE